MNSIKTFSLHLHSESYHPKFLIPNQSPFTSSNPKHKHQNLSFQPIKQQFQYFFIANKCQSHISRKPCSSFPDLTSSFSEENKILKFLKEKAVILLYGSVIFLGFFSFNPKASMAVSEKMNSASENLNEKSDAQMGNSEEERMCEKILENEPRNVEALKVVVYGKMRRGKNKAALEFVQRLIEIEPNEVEWKLLQALCYELMGQLSTAKRLFKEILKERPLLLRALHGLAMVMHKNLEGPAVFQMLSEALEVARCEKRVTEERNIRILIAQMHVVKGELEEGLNKFQDLVKENPRDFRPYLCQGIIYSLLDKKKEAAEQFEIYQSLVPDEFPQRGFLDDVALAAKTKSRERLQREFKAEFASYKKSSEGIQS
ncbi:protein SLOW GREEN 1, chloroplastic-like [Melia azedarach]|uniref:Protein SLOW GREEN 1, chloroplastic-like n=1 Tax=Melia azedarach TaxID=155640 RepID=A0ACC1XVS2_MELAZ|nr:protein SLOW GREEN 1, chloroplastic-like [Melia azedarach]